MTLANVQDVVTLFDAYRIFYAQESNVSAANQFLESRITNEESIIFMALKGDIPVGFTQLYPTFSSVSLQSFLILNDLFVLPEHRGKEIGQALLEKAKSYCKKKNLKGLALETAKENPAQKLYEKLGWKKDEEFLHYFWTNPN